MKPVPLVLNAEGTNKAPLIDVLNDFSLVHVPEFRPDVPFSRLAVDMPQSEVVTTEGRDVNWDLGHSS